MPNPTSTDADLSQFGAYRGLSEQRLSESEERFERRRQTVGLFAGPALGALVLLLPLDLPANQHALAAVFLFTVVYWLTEAIPIPATALLSVSLMVVLRVAPADDILGAFGDSIVLLYLGAFFLSQALLKHGLARRFAYRILSLPVVGNSVIRMIAAFGFVTMCFSSWATPGWPSASAGCWATPSG